MPDAAVNVPVPLYGARPPVAVTVTVALAPLQLIDVAVDEATSAARLVTVNEQVTWLPPASVARYVIVVVLPLANVEPGAGPAICVTVNP